MTGKKNVAEPRFFKRLREKLYPRNFAAIKRVKEWFWTTSNGKINLAVRYGSKTLELGKGKNAIELSTGEELISTLALLKDAVIAGELDDAIANASDKLRAGFGK